MNMRSVESILEEKFHERKGIVGKIFGVDITTRFSKEALIGAIVILADEMEREKENHKRHHDMMTFLQANR